MDEQQQKLKRSLKSRHVTMIAIGGAIGTGLFLGSGKAIQQAGPAIILSYLIVGVFCFFMMRALGELILADTSKHSFIDSVKEYLGDRMEFVAGWMYWACWLTLAMADLTATGIYLKYWFPSLPQWVGPLAIVVLLMLVNMVNVGLFGELESWFSMIKVIAILVLIVVGAVMLLMHSHIENRTVELSNLVNHGGFFPTGPMGFLMSFQMVVFAFVGIEMVGLTAGETKNPQKDIPKAINTLPVRIGLFYIGSMIAMMVIYPWTQIKTTSSPFVQVFAAIGLPGAAGIINFVVLTAAMSATNSAIFSTSRSLYSLSRSGNAPKRFGELSAKAVPNRALTFSSVILFITVILNYIMPAGIFDVIAGISTITFIFTWIIILFAHIKYRQKNPKGVSYFMMPGYPITSWLTIIFFLAVLVILLFIDSTRIPLILSVIIFVALAWGYSLKKNKE
ncbi:amino acid permease [Limosilactobacillus fastidiosus]|uniref:Amino acid permease n=1 Tax=Limosilactobacillus fastidiosus TaxID=2759855 RepID=A0A7W3TZ25_9LACO|nr:amino acid permease [Limosilactobacillus fastidiosus]MBB1085610.1 amino acid permease [Limosilactobacillus fastidiosus]MCD7086063.1 amino acid permease [Limosilactobacillus fastidiosus]MCD7114293.1 amino acid permease [Limosilactobacillus fastidiosus]MCD7116300.1 amino acid permease [Limosilactobacillus fastidiosus]